MIDYTVKKRFTRHKWRGKTFSIFDRKMYLAETMCAEIRREIDSAFIRDMLDRLEEKAK